MIIENVFVSKYCMPISRASTGIYLVLNGIDSSNNRKVIVPANICYAAVFPIIYAGFTPEFCDVDAITGNVTFNTFVAKCSEDVIAAIIPHMYGNPVLELREIADFCKEKNITLIEDCASAMGATYTNYKLGAVGDYTVYSTGYSKTMDLGFGGFLSSDHSLLEFQEAETDLPLFINEYEKDLELFSKIYRIFRNDGNNSKLEREFYKSFPIWCKDSFIHRIDDERKSYIVSQLDRLNLVVSKRREAYKSYCNSLKHIEKYLYKYEAGAVPWRLNLLVSKEQKRILIKNCLQNGLPISDWYPKVTPLFNVDAKFHGAEEHEKAIVNFPILCDDDTFSAICSEIISIIS